MKTRITPRIKATIATGLVLALGGTGYAVQQAVTTGASDPLPIETQVQDHETRIGTLEQREDQTDAKVDKNTGDIQVIQQTAGGGSSSTGGTTSTAPATTTTETTPAPAPAPTPEPAKNPRTIMGVSDTPATSGMHACDYTLYDPGQNVTSSLQPVEVPCYAVGEVLPYV